MVDGWVVEPSAGLSGRHGVGLGLSDSINVKKCGCAGFCAPIHNTILSEMAGGSDHERLDVSRYHIFRSLWEYRERVLTTGPRVEWDLSDNIAKPR